MSKKDFRQNFDVSIADSFVAVEAVIITGTRATAVVRIEVENDDRVVCVAQGTVLLRDPRP